MLVLFLVFGSILLLLGGAIWVWTRWRWRRLGLPSGEIRYTDTSYRPPKPLFSARHGLVGRPDYLIQKRGQIIPLEIKASIAPSVPHNSHIMQLAAYCLLVEEAYGRRPKYGLIQYTNKAFSVEFTEELRQDVLRTLDAMRQWMTSPTPPPVTADRRRCQRCGYRRACGDA